MSRAVHDMFAAIAARYDVTNDVLSFGIHRLWRKTAVRFANIHTGQSVLDLCCGTGDFCTCIAEAVGPTGKVVGLDFVQPMLTIAEDKLQSNTSRTRAPITYIHGDAMDLPFPEHSFDVITVSFGIRNVDDISQVFNEVSRVLKPGGTFVVLEFGQPTIPGFRQIYALYSKYLMPHIGGLLTGNRAAYEYLPETSAAFPAGKAFTALLKRDSFDQVAYRPLFGGIAYLYKGSTPQHAAKPLAEERAA